jgi:F-type H+-transporting ATPase subunit gamma
MLLLLGKNILFHVSELGKKPPTFADSSAIAQEILDSGYEFDVGKMIYNKFR